MEVLAPAGTFDKLRYALAYGADAVYTSGKAFGLRAQAGNLTRDELKKAVKFAHDAKKRIFVTVNIYAHNHHFTVLEEYLSFLNHIDVDAVIVSDPGVFRAVKKVAPNMDIHISTQANVTSWQSAKFWYEAGAKRVILARELSLEEITEFKKQIPELELEVFVHGAMCMSYSGRCLLSAYLNKRSANLGLCTQPCRWKYYLYEETRPEEYFPVEEDLNGTYILNSKDLCLFNRLKDLAAAGIDSIKIEGRMKSLYYVSNVTRVYKKQVDFIKNGHAIQSDLFDELFKVSHRKYTEAFIDGFDSSETQYHESSAYEREYQFIGEIVNFDNGFIEINIRAKFELGDLIELIFPEINEDILYKVNEIFDEENNRVEFTKPNTRIKIPYSEKIPEMGIVRKKI